MAVQIASYENGLLPTHKDPDIRTVIVTDQQILDGNQSSLFQLAFQRLFPDMDSSQESILKKMQLKN